MKTSYGKGQARLTAVIWTVATAFAAVGVVRSGGDIRNVLMLLFFTAAAVIWWGRWYRRSKETNDQEENKDGKGG